MNREQAWELARLATAFADGETLEIYITLHGWTDWNPNGDIPMGDPDCLWRIKPQAPEPLDWWANLYDSGGSLYTTAEEAKRRAGPGFTRVAVHLREVMP